VRRLRAEPRQDLTPPPSCQHRDHAHHWQERQEDECLRVREPLLEDGHIVPVGGEW
jgi:hypothetical protein